MLQVFLLISAFAGFESLAVAEKSTPPSAAQGANGSKAKLKPLGSNVGAVNEGGGSANTTGMNSGLSAHSSGSGTPSALLKNSASRTTSTQTATGTVAPGRPATPNY